MDGKTFRFHDYTGTFVLLAAFSKKKPQKHKSEEEELVYSVQSFL